MAADGVPYTIHGVKVMFPCKAYPTQLSMMDRIMKGLERHQHCLLESPTGSGKSLALLCSCLAWQMAEYEKFKSLKEEKKSDESACCDSPLKPAASSPTVIDLTSTQSPVKHTSPQEISIKTEDSNKSAGDEDEEDDFRSDSKRFRTPFASKTFNTVSDRQNNLLETPSAPTHPPDWRMDVPKTESPPCNENHSPNCNDGKTKNTENIKVPKIYFGTRTHKQVSQIARELGKTAYKHVKMCILSSREHSCIHPRVSKNPNKNEECRKLLDPSIKGETCFYYQKSSVISSQAGIKSRGLATAWDIEDLVRVGKKARACPYYSARELMKEADIIFCPYNYLIDPKIRYQMDINLKDQVVILDEAHNIEDSARESASLTIDTNDLQEVLSDLDKMIQWRIMPTHYQSLHLMCANLMRWITQNSEGGRMQDRGFEQAVMVRSGEEILNGLKDAGITPASCTIYKGIFNEIMAADKDPENNYMKTSPSSQSTSILEGLFLVLEFLFGFDGKFLSDYRLTILKTAHFVRNELAGGWKRAGFGTRKEWKYSLNFWCFNPSVVFSRIGTEARSIILTSGTLSPMSSFASELGVPFPIKLEANHVIANSQVWVGTLSVGPSSSPINATFRSAETYSFQDDVGNVVLDVCQKVPHGVLCFFPSYNMLEKVSKRWQSTGLWAKLLHKKLVLCEPRSGGKSDFDGVMHEFYQAIRRSEGEEDLDCTDSDDESYCGSEGALFLAVCRGKVSEGLDFADNNARAVITIGIPFPNTKDLKVDLKRKYNDAYSSKRGLLNGNEWYEIQAFRALNQALGRCIRHKQDWGAILLVDERFSKTPRYSNGISKWVRQRIHHYKDFQQAVTSLKNFADARQLLACPATQTPTPAATPNVSAGVEGGFFRESSPNKQDCGIPNSTCTPLICKNGTSTTDRALMGSAIFNQSTPGSPLVSANQLAGREWHSTPRSHLQTPVSSEQRSTASCPTTSAQLAVPSNHSIGFSIPTCVTSQPPRSHGITMATTQFPPNFVNTVRQASSTGVRFSEGIQGTPLPQTNGDQIRNVVPMATHVAPRLIFIPNNNNNMAAVSTPTTTRPHVVCLTPVGFNKLATNQGILLPSPNNQPLHVNTPGSHVIASGSHVNTPKNHVNTQGNQLNIPGKHMNTSGSHLTVISNNQPLKNQDVLAQTMNASQNVGNEDCFLSMQANTTKEPGNSKTNSSASNTRTVPKDLSASFKSKTIACETKDVNHVTDTNDVVRQPFVQRDIQENGVKQSNQDGNAKPMDFLVEAKIIKSESEHVPVSEVGMYDCPDSPDMFSTPEEIAQVCSKALEKDSENGIKNINETTHHDLDPEPLHYICTDNDVANDHKAPNCLQTDKQAICNPVKLKASVPEESSSSAKKARIDTNPDSLNTLTSISNTNPIDFEAVTCKQPESVVCDKQIDEKEADKKVSVRRNLRRTARRTIQDVENECQSKDEKIATDEKTLRCKQCNTQLCKGIVDQQNVRCKHLTSLYQKFSNQKTRFNKKRKRGCPSIDRVVWTTSDSNVSREATQPLQGELFNAIYLPKESKIYIPIQCSCCHTSCKDTSVVGVQVVTSLSDTEHKQQVWFFSEAVVNLDTN